MYVRKMHARSRGLKLYHNPSNTNKQRHFYFIRICHLWNALPLIDITLPANLPLEIMSSLISRIILLDLSIPWTLINFTIYVLVASVWPNISLSTTHKFVHNCIMGFFLLCNLLVQFYNFSVLSRLWVLAYRPLAHTSHVSDVYISILYMYLRTYVLIIKFSRI